jgi:hypothetical protein
MDDLRHGSAIKPPHWYRIRWCDLTPTAAEELRASGIELKGLTFNDVTFRDLTGRWPTPRDEV